MPFSRTALVAALVGALLPLAGCGEDAPAEPAAPTTSADSAADSAADDSADPAASPSPSVAPATGLLLEMPNAEIRAPRGWSTGTFLIDMTTEANPRGGGGAVRLTSIEMPQGSTDDVPIDQQARIARQSSSVRPRPEPLEPVRIGGVTWYHLAGPSGRFVHLDSFGTIHDGYQTSVDFELATDLTAAERERLIAASLATFAWR